jgi:hypothetical protein
MDHMCRMGIWILAYYADDVVRPFPRAPLALSRLPPISSLPFFHFLSSSCFFLLDIFPTPPSTVPRYLTLTINASVILWYDHEDFYDLNRIRATAFRSLRRLHSFDICAWRYDENLTPKVVPSPAIHWRRLRYIGNHEYLRGRHVWDGDSETHINVDCYPNQPPSHLWEPNVGKRIEMDCYSRRQLSRELISEGQHVVNTENLQAVKAVDSRIKTLWIT